MGGVSLFRVGEDVEFWRVLIHLSILAACLVLMEKALHHLEKRFPPSEKYQHMLRKAYRELMVLGLISLGLKVLKELPDFDSYSKAIVAFQVADLTIFLLALALILQSTAVFLLLRNQNYRAECAELVSTQDLVDAIKESKDSEVASLSFFRMLLCRCKATRAKANDMELIELRLIRRLFLHRFGLPQLFPFSKYLNRAQASQISNMIEVEPSMWAMVLAVAWAICGLLEVIKIHDHETPENIELVQALMIFAWVLLLSHFLVFLYFRSCVHQLLCTAAFSDNKTLLIANLSTIAEEEAKAWNNEEADKALEIMSCIQEHHEELEFQRRRKKKVNPQQHHGEISERTARLSGVVLESPELNIHFFSHKVWHVVVIFLLILNGFFITLFIQCAFFDMDDIYEEFGALPAVLVPLPLVINAFFLQRRIFYDFVIVSNTLRIDSHTLSDVIENFSEVVRLRSEFASKVLHQLTQLEFDISDLQDELRARDQKNTGYIEVEDLGQVLSKFGFRLTRFRFNCVVKLLFELKGTTVAYAHVVSLVLMAQNEGLHETALARQQTHPMLRPSVSMNDDANYRPSVTPHFNYTNLHMSRQLPILAHPIADAPRASDFVNIGAGSAIDVQARNLRPDGTAIPPPLKHKQHSSVVIHGLFNLQQASNSSSHTNFVRL